MRKPILLAIGLTLATSILLKAQNCTCDVTVRSSFNSVLDFSSFPQTSADIVFHSASSAVLNIGKVLPGTTVCLESRNSKLRLININGDEANYIVIRNVPGQIATVDAGGSYYGLSINDSRYFKLSGAPCNAIDPKQGFRITNVNGVGLTAGGESSDFIFENIEVDNVSSAAIKAKNDVACSGNVSAPGYVMKNVHIHDNYLHDVGNEAMYIGNSFYKTTSCDGVLHEAHDLQNVQIYKNKINECGWDGIQIGGVMSGAVICDNIITSVGTALKGGQASGIQFGDGCQGVVYNNWIEGAYGPGITCTGIGIIKIYQNIILETGEDGIKLQPTTSPQAFPYMLPEQYEMKKVFIFNNTFMGMDGNGIGIYAGNHQSSPHETFINNNIITDYNRRASQHNYPIRFVSHSANVSGAYDGLVHTGNNIIEKNRSQLGFVKSLVNKAHQRGPGNKTDVNLRASSIAINSGIIIPNWNVSVGSVISYDFYGNARMYSDADCGATEFNGVSSNTPLASTASYDYTIPADLNGLDAQRMPSGSKVLLTGNSRHQLRILKMKGDSTQPIIINSQESHLSFNIKPGSRLPALKINDSQNLHLIPGTGKKLSLNSVNHALECIECEGELVLSGIEMNLSGAGKYGVFLKPTSGSVAFLSNVTFQDLKINGMSNARYAIKSSTPFQKLTVNRCLFKNFSSTMASKAIDVSILPGASDAYIVNSIFDGFPYANGIGDIIYFNGGSLDSIGVHHNTFVNIASSKIFKQGGGFTFNTFGFYNNAIQTQLITGTAGVVQDNAKGFLQLPAGAVDVKDCFVTSLFADLKIDSIFYTPNSDLLSPLVNSGGSINSISLIAQDFYRLSRDWSLNPDIGACESQSNASKRRTGSLNNAREIRIYPNPTRGELNMELPTGEDIVGIKIFDNLGRVIYQEEQVSVNSELQLSDVIAYSGMALVCLVLKEGTFEQRVIFQ